MMEDSNVSEGIAVGRLLGLVFAAAISALVSYFGQPYISDNKDAVNAVVTVFSILAGFLVAVITFIGDPGARGWKELQLDKRAVEAKLRRHRLLFYLYLATLGGALAMFMLPCGFPELKMWLERVFLFLATFVFMISFSLPSSLSALQLERYQAALDEDKPDSLK